MPGEAWSSSATNEPPHSGNPPGSLQRVGQGRVEMGRGEAVARRTAGGLSVDDPAFPRALPWFVHTAVQPDSRWEDTDPAASN